MGLPDWPGMGLPIHIGASPNVAAKLCVCPEVPLDRSLQACFESWQELVREVEVEGKRCEDGGP